MLDPKGGEGVVVETDATGKPAIGVVLGAQPIERASTADALERRIKPQRHQDRRIDRGPSRMSLDRLDANV